MLMKKAERDVGAPALHPGDLDQVDHRLPHVLWDAKGPPHRTLAEQRIWQLLACIKREPAAARRKNRTRPARGWAAGTPEGHIRVFSQRIRSRGESSRMGPPQ